MENSIFAVKHEMFALFFCPCYLCIAYDRDEYTNILYFSRLK